MTCHFGQFNRSPIASHRIVSYDFYHRSIDALNDTAAAADHNNLGARSQTVSIELDKLNLVFVAFH